MLPRAKAATLRPAAARPARGRLVALAAVALALAAPCLALRAAAEEPVEPIRLVYEAAPGCPDAADFAGEVRGRTSRARAAEPGESARSFTVRIARAGRSFRGHLEVREPGGATSARDVASTSCAEVASAIALVTALAIDPQAVTAPRPPAPASAAPPLLPTASTDAGPPPDAASPDALAPPAPDAAPPDASAPAPEPPPPVAPIAPPAAPIDDDALYASRPVRLLVGLSATAGTGLAAKLTLAPAAFLELGLAPRGVVAPVLRLGLERVASASLVAPGGWLTRFDRTLARLDLVALRVPLGPAELAPFAGLGAGALVATGVVAATTTSRTRPWVDASVGARARLWLLGRASLELDGGFSFPFVRDTFAIDPSLDVERTPAAAAFVGLAAAVRAW